MELMEIAEKLRQLCGTHRITPTELGREIGGVSKTTMYNWTNGIGRPDLASSLKIARYFRVPLEYLADDAQEAVADAVPEVSEDESAILVLCRALKLDRDEAMRRLSVPSYVQGSFVMGSQPKQIEPPGGHKTVVPEPVPGPGQKRRKSS